MFRTRRDGPDWAGWKENQTGVSGMKNLVSKFFKDESGATAIEYGLIAALIAVAIIVTVGLVGDELVNTFESIEDGLAGETE
jgi:pilus assembly protein Flp/PilA